MTVYQRVNGNWKLIYPTIPNKNGGSFHSFLYVYQRVNGNLPHKNGGSFHSSVMWHLTVDRRLSLGESLGIIAQIGNNEGVDHQLSQLVAYWKPCSCTWMRISGNCGYIVIYMYISYIYIYVQNMIDDIWYMKYDMWYDMHTSLSLSVYSKFYLTGHLSIYQWTWLYTT